MAYLKDPFKHLVLEPHRQSNPNRTTCRSRFVLFAVFLNKYSKIYLRKIFELNKSCLLLLTPSQILAILPGFFETILRNQTQRIFVKNVESFVKCYKALSTANGSLVQTIIRWRNFTGNYQGIRNRAELSRLDRNPVGNKSPKSWIHHPAKLTPSETLIHHGEQHPANQFTLFCTWKLEANLEFNLILEKYQKPLK